MLSKLYLILLFGYSALTRSFAYVGFPNIHLFIGEIALAYFLLRNYRETLVIFMSSMLKYSPLSGLVWAMYLSLVYGIFQVIRGIGEGYSAIIVLQSLVFNVYPLYILMGMWVGLNRQELIPRIVVFFAWWHGLYGILYILFLDQISWFIPFTDNIPIFGQPGAAALSVLALIAFEKNFLKFWFPMALNVAVMIAMQVRAEWLGFVVAVFVWGVISKKFGRLVSSASILLVIVLLMYVFDINIPSPSARGGVISLQEIIGRGLAGINVQLAEHYTSNAADYAGTVSWRIEWWKEIWIAVHSSFSHSLLGLAYGYPLSDLVPFIESSSIRTPHSVFFYALGYSGWLGVLIFFLFQLAIFKLLYRVYTCTRQPFGLSYFFMFLTMALTSNLFETPFGAIPYYLIVGALISSTLYSKKSDFYARFN